jgi:hypothetical protein
MSEGGPRAGAREWAAALAPFLAQAGLTAWLFSGVLFEGRVFYFRDVSVYYYPNYVFLETWLRQGVWPLWNPTSDAGAPYLAAYPVELAMVALLGARDALRFGAPVHLLLAMSGASRLASVLGMGRWAAFAAGAFFGLSGYTLSTANLIPLLQAAAWAPWVIAAVVRLWSEPSRQAVGHVALLTGLQVSTLSAETVAQTAIFAAALLPGRAGRRPLAAGFAGLVLLVLLTAPVLVGAHGLLEGTARTQGLSHHEAFAASLRPAVLLEAVLPRFFGDVHSFSDLGYWGQRFFPSGFPYFVSLYCGPIVLWLALRSGQSPERWRLAALLVLGVLLALGTHGPLEAAMQPLMRSFRTPPKFLFLSTLALSLLAARGLETLGKAPHRRTPALALAGAGLLFAALPALQARPDLPQRLFGSLLPELRDPRASPVVAGQWPARFATTGALLAAAALAARRKPLVPLAGLLAVCDLLLVNGEINLATNPEFYRLQSPVRDLVDATRGGAPHRWFAYGGGAVRDLRWEPKVALLNRDVWLYYVDRQALLPRAHVLDGLEGAFDEDRTAWAPPGSTLAVAERTPARYREHHGRLRLANVRYVASFRPLPDDLVSLRGTARLREVQEPLQVYELRDALPRAFRVPSHAVVAEASERARLLASPEFDPTTAVVLEEPLPPPAPREDIGQGSAAITWSRPDPHTVVLASRGGGPGFLVVSEGFHRDWHAEASGADRPLRRANGRYWAIPTPGGAETVVVRYRPRYMREALVTAGVALLVALGLISRSDGEGRLL